MSDIESSSPMIAEIMELEEKLRQAELGPHPEFFEKYMADNALIDGKPLKSKIVEAHRPGSQHKFTKVEMSNFQTTEHGNCVVLLCQGNYEGSHWSGTMKFMRIWVKTGSQWQIVAATTLQ